MVLRIVERFKNPINSTKRADGSTRFAALG
jgi:hypothetical protein